MLYLKTVFFQSYKKHRRRINLKSGAVKGEFKKNCLGKFLGSFEMEYKINGITNFFLNNISIPTGMNYSNSYNGTSFHFIKTA